MANPNISFDPLPISSEVLVRQRLKSSQLFCIMCNETVTRECIGQNNYKYNNVVILRSVLKLKVPVSYVCGVQTWCSYTLQWRHNVRGGISNHQPHDCLLHRLFRRRSKKTSKLRVTGLCAGTGEFPSQMGSNEKNVSFDDVIMRCLVAL